MVRPMTAGRGATAWPRPSPPAPAAGRVLDTWYPAPALGEPPRGASAPHELASLTGSQERRERPRRAARRRRSARSTWTPRRPTPADAYLRLHLLSHRLVPPHGLNLDGIFGVLPNVVWTSVGPCAVEDFERTRLALRRTGPGARPRRRQVPADDRLRAADRRPDRRRRPGSARCAPRRRHHGHARGLRQLQRRHARRVDGRGTDLGRRRRRRRLRRRRRRVDHGHAVRRRQGAASRSAGAA